MCRLEHWSVRVLRQKIDSMLFERSAIAKKPGSIIANEIDNKNGRIGGRPAIMTDDKIRSAKSMIKDTENYPFISDIIKTLCIGRTTFYRHFPTEKIQEIRPEN